MQLHHAARSSCFTWYSKAGLLARLVVERGSRPEMLRVPDQNIASPTELEWPGPL